MVNILVTLSDEVTPDYSAALAAMPDVTLVDSSDPNAVEIVVYEPNQPLQDFSIFPNLRFVQSIWAGVDRLIGNETLTVPVARLVDHGLREGMREYMLGHILADHIEISRFEHAAHWNDRWLPLARHKTVGILGFGVLGQAVGEAAAAIGFQVIGWSSTPKDHPIRNLGGAEALAELLAGSDYLVLLLPHTKETEDFINAETLAQMRPNAMLINAGRGALVDEAALITALDAGAIRRAVLDVFKTEPLPQEHPFWTHPKVLVTPHIAAKSRLETAIAIIRANIDNDRAGRPLDYRVDFSRGY